MKIVDLYGDFILDVLTFLEQPEHEILNAVPESEDVTHSLYTYCGLSLGWETERDALIKRAREILSSENQSPTEEG